MGLFEIFLLLEMIRLARCLGEIGYHFRYPKEKHPGIQGFRGSLLLYLPCKYILHGVWENYGTGSGTYGLLLS
jgi:hypothetical protein